MYVASNYTLSMTCLSFPFLKPQTHILFMGIFFVVVVSLCQFSMPFALNICVQNSSSIWHWQNHLFYMFTGYVRVCHMLTLDLNRRVIWILYFCLLQCHMCRSKYKKKKIKVRPRNKKNDCDVVKPTHTDTRIHNCIVNSNPNLNCKIWIKIYSIKWLNWKLISFYRCEFRRWSFIVSVFKRFQVDYGFFYLLYSM